MRGAGEGRVAMNRGQGGRFRLTEGLVAGSMSRMVRRSNRFGRDEDGECPRSRWGDGGEAGVGFSPRARVDRDRRRTPRWVRTGSIRVPEAPR